MAAVVRYFDQFERGDAAVPSKEALLPLSKVLDSTMQSVMTDLMNKLRESPEHQARVALLQKQPRTAGKFSESKILLKEASPFEQMVAVSDWLARKHIRDDHTLFLSASGDDYVPLRVKKLPSTDATMMNVILGVTNGTHKSPKYKQWAQTNPWQDPLQKVFIYPLEALEIVRQPQYSAATVLKGNAFEGDHILPDWRYGLPCACVESGSQSRSSPKKDRSAGLNACKLVEAFSDDSDPLAEERDVCLPIQFEEYSDEGYDDDLEIPVTPGKLMQAAEMAIVRRDPHELNRLMEDLAIAKIGVPRTPLLCDYIAGKLRANSVEDRP